MILFRCISFYSPLYGPVPLSNALLGLPIYFVYLFTLYNYLLFTYSVSMYSSYCIILIVSITLSISILLSYLYYRVIVLISVNIVPSWDIEGRELASVRRYPNKGHYSPISVR